ncbi:MAG: hypothetical protein L6244_03215 [Candidatus Methanoperedenaceae archaeon]|nr:hypothetical protein [Candidatus Methanoperedenaceae archaeon]
MRLYKPKVCVDTSAIVKWLSLILSAGYLDMPMLMTGADAVVTKDVEANAVVGGVPARVIGER